MSDALTTLAESLYREMFGEELNLPISYNPAFTISLGETFSTRAGRILTPTNIEIAERLKKDPDLLSVVLKNQLIYAHCMKQYKETPRAKIFRDLCKRFGVPVVIGASIEEKYKKPYMRGEIL